MQLKKKKEKKHFIEKKQKEKKYCEACGKEITSKYSYRMKYCSEECFHRVNTKFEVTKEQLINDFSELKTYVSVAKKYGVSDKAIKKRVIKLGIINDIKNK